MKKFLYLLFAGAAAMTQVSCNSEACKDADCGSKGECVDIVGEPVCVCRNGWEQDANGRCEIRATAKFAGVWSVTESCTDNVSGQTFPATYNITITESGSDTTRIVMANFGGTTCVGGTQVLVTAVAADNLFSVDAGPFCPDPAQNFSGQNFTGQGTISADRKTITGNYTLTFTDQGTNFSYTCTYTATKQ
jgi:hypothetical protein